MDSVMEFIRDHRPYLILFLTIILVIIGSLVGFVAAVYLGPVIYWML